MMNPHLPFALQLFFLLLVSSCTASFSGANNYYIHGMLDNVNGHDVINQWAADLASYDASLVRLWVTGTGGYQKGNLTSQIYNLENDEIGVYNDTVLDAIDEVLAILANNKLKAIIMPHNGNELDPSGTGQCDIYCSTYTAQGFYSNTPNSTLPPSLAHPFDAYAARLDHILNYKSLSFNKLWKDLPEVIYAFDIQNEAFIANEQTKALAVANDPYNWTCSTATAMRNSGLSSDIHITSGGIVNGEYSGYNFAILDAALDCAAIDIYSFHGFTPAQGWQDYFINGNLTKTKGKPILVEEWGAQSFVDFVNITTTFDDIGIPWLYWEVTPGPDDAYYQCPGIVAQDYPNVTPTAGNAAYASLLTACQTSFDGNELGGFNATNLTALATAMKAAAIAPLGSLAAPVP